MGWKHRILALGLAAAYLVALALAASPAFHHWFHGDDADEPGHVCAATALQDGQIDCVQPVAPVIGAPEENGIAGDFLRVQSFPLGFLPAAPGERAPPVA